MKKLIFIFGFILLTGCTFGGADLRPTTPMFFPPPPEGGPQEFQQGWQDGCETGMAAHGSDLYRLSYKFRQDPSLLTDKAYYKAWKDAENYCRTYIFEYLYRSTTLYCTLDGLQNDCAGKENNKIPFVANSTGGLENSMFGKGLDGVGAVMGGSDERFVGNTSGIDPLFGSW